MMLRSCYKITYAVCRFLCTEHRKRKASSGRGSNATSKEVATPAKEDSTKRAKRDDESASSKEASDKGKKEKQPVPTSSSVVPTSEEAKRSQLQKQVTDEEAPVEETEEVDLPKEVPAPPPLPPPRRPSYTPVPLDDYPSNHFSPPPAHDCVGGNPDPAEEYSTMPGPSGGFCMPADFDIPVDIIKTQAEQAGRAKYAGDHERTRSASGKGETEVRFVNFYSMYTKVMAVRMTASTTSMKNMVAITTNLMKPSSLTMRVSVPKARTVTTPRRATVTTNQSLRTQ